MTTPRTEAVDDWHRADPELTTAYMVGFEKGKDAARAALLAELEEDIYRSLGHDLRELAQGAEEALHCIWPTMMLRVLDLIRKEAEG